MASDTGRIRKDNQDSYFANGTVFAVADGMGGHAGGEIASRLAVDVFAEAFPSDSQDGPDIIEVVRAANSAILSRASKEPKLSGMGTTLCTLSLSSNGTRNFLNLINVGDSRGYLYRNGELYQLTDDHTLVSEMLKSGDITSDQAGDHRAKHILTRALGVDPDLEIDHWEIEPKKDDLYLLCSDGLTNEMTDPEIAMILSGGGSSDQMAQDLVNGALANGGSDNVTCLVIRVQEETSSDEISKGDRSRIVELPSQTKLRERLQNATRSVGADTVERGRPISVAQLQEKREEKSGPIAEPEAQNTETRPAGASVRVNPVITSSTMRSPELSAIPTPLPKRATEKKVRFGTLLRSLIFLLILAVVIVIGVSAVGIYAKHSYFVGLDNSKVAIYQGRPGGLLWYDPTLVRETQLKESQVAPYHIPDLQKGVVEPSLSAANSYVNRLLSESTQISTISSAPQTTKSASATPTTTLAGGSG